MKHHPKKSAIPGLKLNDPLHQLFERTPNDDYLEGRRDGFCAAVFFLSDARTTKSHVVRTAALFHIITGGVTTAESLAKKLKVTVRRMQQEIAACRTFAGLAANNELPPG